MGKACAVLIEAKVSIGFFYRLESSGSDLVVCLEELLLLTFIDASSFSICNVSFFKYSMLQTFRKYKILHL